MSFDKGGRKYLPLLLDITDKVILVVGGGQATLSKLRALEPFLPLVRLVAPGIIPEVSRLLAGFPLSEVRQRPFEEGDLEGVFLVYAYTDAPEVNAQIVASAHQKGLLAIAPGPRKDFLSPAAGKEGDWIFAVSSLGHNIAGAVALRDQIRGLILNEPSN